MIAPAAAAARLQFGAEAVLGAEHFERHRGGEQLLVAGGDHGYAAAAVGQHVVAVGDAGARAPATSIEQLLGLPALRRLGLGGGRLLGERLR